MEDDLQKLKDKYKIPSFNDADVVLGMRITRNRSKRTLKLDQQVYIEQMIQNFELHNANPAPSPEDSRQGVPSVMQQGKANMKKRKKDKDGNEIEETTISTRTSVDVAEMIEEADDYDADEEHDPTTINAAVERYGSLVGALMYAAMSTRPDISHAASMRARCLRNPTSDDWRKAKRILRYLKGTSTLGLTYGGDPECSTWNIGPAYCDANWGGVSGTDRKSTTGNLVKVNGGIVSWASKKQNVVALSTAEAEYMAAGMMATEVMWTRQLLNEMGFEQPAPTVILCDNQPAIQIASDDFHHGRTKHIDIKYHFIKDMVKNNHIKMNHVSSALQQADILTKALGVILFTRLRDQVMQGNTYREGTNINKYIKS